jgi:cysteine desulfurase
MLAGQDNETLLMRLDELGIACASGSACNANKQSLSTALLAIGLSNEQVRSSLRFSTGHQTTKRELSATIAGLLRSLS